MMDPEKTTPERNEAGQYRKGVSGNPAGRPRRNGYSVREALSGHVSTTIQRLVWLRDNGETHEVQLKACREILNRAIGTPLAAVPEEDDNDRPDKNPGAVVASIIKRARGGPADGCSAKPDLGAVQLPTDSRDLQ